MLHKKTKQDKIHQFHGKHIKKVINHPKLDTYSTIIAGEIFILLFFIKSLTLKIVKGVYRKKKESDPTDTIYSLLT
jgi:hypothetical protein